MSGIIGDPAAKSGVIGLKTPVSLPYFAGTDTDANGPANDNGERVWDADNVYYDTRSWWDHTNNRYIPKIKGLYAAQVGANFSKAKGVGRFYIRKNGTTFAVGYKDSTDTTNGEWFCVYTSGITEMNGVDDYIDCQIDGYIDGGARWNQFTIYLIQHTLYNST